MWKWSSSCTLVSGLHGYVVNVYFQMSEISVHTREGTHFLLGEAVPSNDKSWYLKIRVKKPVSRSQSQRASACGNLKSVPWFCSRQMVVSWLVFFWFGLFVVFFLNYFFVSCRYIILFLPCFEGWSGWKCYSKHSCVTRKCWYSK